MLMSQATAALVAHRLPPGVELRDVGEVRLRDIATPEHLFQLVHPDLRRDFPPLRSLASTPNNLPSQMTSFVGREREMTELKELLSRSRLVTVLGVGGLGKTRVSLQVAADMLDAYKDGVWFVELAPLSDPRLVPQAVASALNVGEEPGRPLMEALSKFVRDRALLLVLDNCEHLIRACAGFAAQLLQAGERITILASSREPLHVAGEINYSLPALALPRSESISDVAAASACAAVRLFAERAAAANHSFRLTSDNVAPVVDVCRRLDGIPLAIELAAARLRSLSIATLASRLFDRFRLLTRGDRSTLPRQQTLRATIDWSYDLLTEDERALVRRLSVFAGGWTLDAAEHVGAGALGDSPAVVDVLANLVDKSLVELDNEANRYRLLESIREYAQDRLNESDEAAAVRDRHLAYYVTFAEEVNPKLVGPDQGTWLARLDLERENLFAAHAWCDHAQDGGELGLRLVHAVKLYLFNRDLLALLRQGAADALARPGAQQPTSARCRVLFAAGQVNCFIGRYADANAYLKESLSIAREIGDSQRAAAVLQVLGMAALGEGKRALARQNFEEALPIVRSHGNQRELAAVLTALAQLDRMEGRLDAAELLCDQVLELSRALGDRETIAISLLNLAMVSIARGTDQSAQMLAEALTIAIETGSRRTGESLLQVIAGLASSRAKHACAARFAGAAEAEMKRTGLRSDAADEAFLAPWITRTRDAIGAAAFEASRAAGAALSYDDALEEAAAWLKQQL
jgi:predicted ATPase